MFFQVGKLPSLWRKAPETRNKVVFSFIMERETYPAGLFSKLSQSIGDCSFRLLVIVQTLFCERNVKKSFLETEYDSSYP